jgi:hypothetical protein
MSENDNVSETVGVPPDDAPDDILERATGEGDEGVIYDEGYSPPERPLGLFAHGTTAEEERQGETLDQRLAEEEPEEPVMAQDPGGARGIRAPGEADAFGDVEADEDTDGELLDDQVGDRRAGRLVEPDEGAHTDAEKDAVASDVGIDGGAASAEEAAMHVVDEDELDR